MLLLVVHCSQWGTFLQSEFWIYIPNSRCYEPSGHGVAIDTSQSLWLTAMKSCLPPLNLQTTAAKGTEPHFLQLPRGAE